ncbi:MAG: TonB-dependent receptor [Bacteroidetes bacterium]|nr:TonB-dependent receptor [Bacteroidota bacterium]MCW5895822.1 TonB-dependent receptor [Bacteroidota bacterium]
MQSFHWKYAALFLAAAVVQAATGELRAQHNVQIDGRVVDAVTRLSLPGASVILLELMQGQSTKNDGTFSLEVPPGTYHLLTRYVGYADDTLAVSLATNTSLTIRLMPVDVRLSEVQSTAERDKEYLQRSSRAIAVLTKKELDKHRGQTLGKTLENIPGVTLLQTGPSIAKPVVRGLHSQRVLVLNAGIPQEGQQWGGEHAPEIDPFSPSRIEVLKGAAGVEYGAGAIGGVIRVEPRTFRELPGMHGEVSLNAFSNNLQGSGAVFLEGAHEALPGFAWRVQGSLRKAGDTRTSAYVMNNSGFSEVDASGGIRYATGRWSSEVYYSHFGTILGIFRGSHIGNITDLMQAITDGRPQVVTPFSYAINRPKQEIRHDLFSLRSSLMFPGVGELTTQFGYQQNNRLEYDAHRAYNDSLAALNAPSFDLTLTTYTADVKFKHVPVNGLFGSIGVSGMRQGNVRAGSVFLVPNFRAYSAGVYALESWARDRLTLTAGVRYDFRQVEVYPFNFRGLQQRMHTYGGLSVAFSALYLLSDSWSVGSSIGSAWRPPSINEMYSNDIHHGTAQFEIGDLNLDTERSLSLDVTVKHAGERTNAEFSLYSNVMNRFIFLFPDPQPTLTIRGAFPTFRYMQADAVLSGFEGSFEIRASELLKLGITGSLVRGDNRSTREPLIGMPADRVRLLTHFDIGDFSTFSNTYVEIVSNFVRKQDRVPANADYAASPAGYALLDFGMGGELSFGTQAIAIDLTVQNLLNRSYRDYLSRFRYFTDDPGVNAVLRVRIPIGESAE